MFYTCQKLACPNTVLLALEAACSDRLFKRAFGSHHHACAALEHCFLAMPA